MTRSNIPRRLACERHLRVVRMEHGDDPLELAEESTGRVAAVARKIAQERKSQYLWELAAELFIVHTVLDRPTASQLELFRRRIKKLLVELEKVCTVSAPTGPPRESSIGDGAFSL